MSKKIKKVKKCLLCGRSKLRSLFNVGNLYVSNFVTKNNIYNGTKSKLNLLYCSNCTLIQLSHLAPQEIMYRRFYWYKSGVTKTMREGLKELFLDCVKKAKLKKNDVILDIGANDGTLLKYFKINKFKTIGCEPATNLKSELKKNCNYLISDFWSKKKLFKLLKRKRIKKPKLITAIGMFYDLEDPNKFIKDAADSLDDRGIFVAQLMSLKSMIEKNDLGNICHEHIEFYSFKSIKYLFEKNGLEIFKISSNDINGGSYRFYCRKFKRGSIRLPKENILKMMKKFVYRVKMNKRITVNFIKKQIENNKKIFLYGASTKGNTVLQYYGLNKEMIPYAAERSPFKWGKYTIGTGIKIISEKQAKKMKPDFFFVTPWGFIKEFIKREKNWLNNGGKFILPFPKMKIIGRK